MALPFLSSGPSRLLVVSILLGTVFMMVTTPVLSQRVQERGREFFQNRDPDRAASPNLPRWAEPSESPARDAEPRRIQPLDGSSVDGSMRTNAPPPGPAPTPVDGGVALLAAAGAGYAVRKLSEDDEDDEPA